MDTRVWARTLFSYWMCVSISETLFSEFWFFFFHCVYLFCVCVLFGARLQLQLILFYSLPEYVYYIAIGSHLYTHELYINSLLAKEQTYKNTAYLLAHSIHISPIIFSKCNWMGKKVYGYTRSIGSVATHTLVLYGVKPTTGLDLGNHINIVQSYTVRWPYFCVFDR